jgi:hypothetical protein
MRAYAGDGMRLRRATLLLLAAILAASSIAAGATSASADSTAVVAAKKKKCKKGFVRKKGKCRRKPPAGAITPGITGPGGTTALTGGPTSLSITPTSHDFGSVPPEEHSDPQTFLVANTGPNQASPITFTTEGENGDEFHVSHDFCSGRTLLPGGTCTLDVEFVPGPGSLFQTRSGSLRINGPPAAPVFATLSGCGGFCP